MIRSRARLAAVLLVPMLLLTSLGSSRGLQSTRPESPQSPRIEQLRQDLEADRDKALEAFWTELKQNGTPLLEATDDDHTLVSFVWRGGPDTRNVIVNVDAEPIFRNLQLHRLSDTDVWYRTYRLPSEAQFYYQFSPNDSLVPFNEVTDWASRAETFVSDPLNPQGITIGNRSFSFAVLPAAKKPAEYQVREPASEGAFEPSTRQAFAIQSPTLGDHRVWIYTTPGLARPAGQVNLLIFVDGSGAWQLIPSRRMLDNLFADGRIGPTIAVYTDSPDRERDLACSDEYLALLIDELLPFVAERYGAQFQPGKTVISGRSLGGLFAGYAVWRRPDAFGGALLQSPSLWWGNTRDGENEWLTRQIASSPAVSARFYVAPGMFETQTNSPSSISILFSSRHFRDVLTAKGYGMKYREVAGGHDPLNWEMSLPEGVVYLLGRED